jgi:hypothetical protein
MQEKGFCGFFALDNCALIALAVFRWETDDQLSQGF